MIRYFCDRCKKELTSYEYEHEAITVSLLSQDDPEGLTIKKLCPKCETELIKFMKGDKDND